MRERPGAASWLPLALLAGAFLVAGQHAGRAGAGAVPAHLSVTVIDAATAQPTPVRVLLTGGEGAAVAPPGASIAVMYGRDDRAQGYAAQPDGAFYVDGSFDVELEPGTYRIALSKGFEYLSREDEIALLAGDSVSRSYALERWIDMPAAGWYSADDHIHIRRSPRENPLILQWIAAEDIHVGGLLQMGDFWTTFYAQYAWGTEGVYKVEDRFLTSGQEEPRTHELGHTISLGAEAFVRFPRRYYLYDRVFDRVHELGGLTGYAHQGVLFQGHLGMTLDVLRHKVDFLELLQFCAPEGPLHLDLYYHFLDLGYALTATAGSDFPWCGIGEGWNARIGNARFYTFVGEGAGAFGFESWRAAVRQGRTFVTSGPMLDLRVNGRMPGDRWNVARGAIVRVSARAFGHREQVPLAQLEVVGHGEVLASARAGEPGQSAERLTVDLELPAAHGVWIAARARAGATQLAHTTPVYVTVDGGGFHNPATVSRRLDVVEGWLLELEELIVSQGHEGVAEHAWRYREELEARIAQTREMVRRLRAEVK